MGDERGKGGRRRLARETGANGHGGVMMFRRVYFEYGEHSNRQERSLTLKGDDKQLILGILRRTKSCKKDVFVCYWEMLCRIEPYVGDPKEGEQGR